MSGVTVALCRTRDRLYEEYEGIVLKRIAHRKGSFALMQVSELKSLELQIAQALRDLQEHERTHRCR